jgi:hypothetical protein
MVDCGLQNQSVLKPGVHSPNLVIARYGNETWNQG